MGCKHTSKREVYRSKSYIDACVWNLKRGIGTDEPICRAAVETQTQRTDFRTQCGEERVGRTEREAWKHTHM